MKVTIILKQNLLFIVCMLMLDVRITHSRTTFKSKRDRTTANNKVETTTTITSSKSLLDIPQNDIYNNKVDEDIPLIPVTNPFTREEKSRISWNILNRNNAKNPPRKYTQMPNEKLMRGPTGPRGPPGATMTKDDMTKEFKKMVKSAANKKARKIIKAQCPTCDVKEVDGDVLSFFYPGVEDKIRTVNRAPMAFTTKLLNKIDIYPEKSVLLRRFQLAGTQYSLIRGVPADMGMSGKFTVDSAGIYQFTATLNFHSGHKVATSLRSNHVQVLICPNGQCIPSESSRNPTVTQYIHSMDSRQRYFSIQLTAMLDLKKSDYVSIYVKNSCRRTIDLQPGSLMTGIMLSV